MSLLPVLLSALLAAPSPQAVQERERGDRLAQNGDVAGALEAYRSAIRIDPGFAAPYNEMGILYVNQGRNDEAVVQFQQALKVDPGFALAWNNLGFVLRRMGRYAEAVTAYERYVALEPGDAAGLYGLAEAHRGAGNKAAALTAYEKYLLVDQDPKNQKRRDRAQGYAEALRGELGPAAPPPPGDSGPPLPAAPGGAALAGAANGAAGAAPVSPAPGPAEAARPPAGVSPEQADLCKQKMAEALELRQAGKMRESLLTLQDAVNADPTNVYALAELGIAYAVLGYFPQAIERWQRVLSLTQDEGIRASAIQNIDRARQKLEGKPTAPSSPAAGATPTYQAQANAAYARGVELFGQGQFAEALQQFDGAIQVRPDFAQAFAARGSAHYALGNYTRALSDYAQAMKLDSGLASPLFGLGETLVALGKKADAVVYYQAYVASKAADVQPALQEVARQRLSQLSP